MSCSGDYIVVDPKGALYERYKDGLAESGYEVGLIDFRDPGRSTLHWSPLDHLDSEQDVYSACERLVTAHGRNQRDPFWDLSAIQYLQVLVYLAKARAAERAANELARWGDGPRGRARPSDRTRMQDIMAFMENAHERVNGETRKTKLDAEMSKLKFLMPNPSLSEREAALKAAWDELLVYTTDVQAAALGRGIYDGRRDTAAAKSVERHFRRIGKTVKAVERRIGRVRARREQVLEYCTRCRTEACYAWTKWTNVRGCADKTYESIRITAEANLEPLFTVALADLMDGDGERLDVGGFGRGRRAVFICISDTDRSMDFLAKLCLEQVINELTKLADNRPGGRFRRPVRVIVDDFATMGSFPLVGSWINSLRSRNIGLTLVCQSLAQLRGVYRDADGLVAACDMCLFVGDQNDPETRRYIAQRVGSDRFATTFNETAWAFVRGRKPHVGLLFEPERHPNYPRFELARELADRLPPWMDELERDDGVELC